MSEILKLILLVVFLVAVIIFSPLIVIWALNTLFLLGIPYTFWTWLATAILQGLVVARNRVQISGG